MKITRQRIAFALPVILLFLFTACHHDPVPKPRAVLRLEYPEPSYEATSPPHCPFRFEKNSIAQIGDKGHCRLDIGYPEMKATIFLTYMPVENNLKELMTDAEKLTFDHVVKADEIGVGGQFENAESRVYGRLYEVAGNAASQVQFYVTDSTSHFLTGSLYFYSRPNYDSILPAAKYLGRDIRRLMESLRWENNDISRPGTVSD
ncbi:gliding motility lipoprotein GldD [Sinomicrobium soli]|uniref:gliding motility lipoprotein GldD n=1 Tax=Sinomicrobium sp. N-1-3-6 TaxID=2219864 RepID=UPI000DCBB902|nr:gliding motility lipoprotein GldD [Sinomicrobium sp. N-1-3-6]RAV28119.1 gliding motility lipoprotein GldD [Sinomicrobium sp. N-1-3-6]